MFDRETLLAIVGERGPMFGDEVLTALIEHQLDELVAAGELKRDRDQDGRPVYRSA